MYDSSGSNFSRAFIMKIYLFLSSAFSVSMKMIIWIFILKFIYNDVLYLLLCIH